jgi:putative flippase GtrA
MHEFTRLSEQVRCENIPPLRTRSGVVNKMEENQRRNARELGLMFVKFTAFSIGAAVIQLISFFMLNEWTDLETWVSYVIALALSVVYNFTVNRRFTFRSVNNVPVAMLLVLAFYCVFTPYSAWLMHYLTGTTLFDMGDGWYIYLVLIFIMLQNLVLEFLWWRFVIFKKSINTRPRKAK